MCLTDALTEQGCLSLLEESGFQVARRLDSSQEIIKILDEVESKLAAYLAFQRLNGQSAEGPLQQAARLIAAVRELVGAGRLGYWLFVADKPT